MRVIIFGLCALFVLGIFVTMFVSIWSTSRQRGPRLHLRHSLAAEMVWAAIPCLMLVGAAIPAALVILTPPAVPPPEAGPVPAPAQEPGGPAPTLIAPSPAPASTGRTRGRWLNAEGNLADRAYFEVPVASDR